MHNVHVLSAPLGRLFLATIFIMAGLNKIGGYAGTQGYMEAMGVPGSLLPGVIALEVLGGLAVVIGYKARLAAYLMAGFTVLSAIIFHSNFHDQTQFMMFFKNIAIAGGFLIIAVHGAGTYSVDNRKNPA
tara:strand:- start:420 stop:809 length:390 start_codon:yes stop_codon:yes gene_type:complete